MINVGIAVQQKFLSDSVDKQVRLEFDTNTDLSQVNWYAGDLDASSGGTAAFQPSIPTGNGYSYFYTLYNTSEGWTHIADYLDRVKYICVDFDIALIGKTANQLPAKCKIGFQYINDGDGRNYRAHDVIDTSIVIKETTSLRARVSIIRKFDNNAYNIRKITNIVFGFVPDENFPQGEDVYVPDLRFGGIQYDLSNDISELPFTKNGNAYIKTNAYLDHIVDDGPAIPDITNEDIQLESLSLTESLCSQDNLKFGCCEAAHFEIGIVNHHQKFFNKIIRPYICCYKKTDPDYDPLGDVPLGVFRIQDVKQEYMYEFDKKTLTAYDFMTVLDTDVGDWLSKYMWVWNTANTGSSHSPGFTRSGVEYARQMFPTFINLMKRLGLVSDDDFSRTFLYSIDFDTGNFNYGYNYLWYDTPGYSDVVLCLKKVITYSWGGEYPPPEGMCIEVKPRGGKTDAELREDYSGYAIKTDDNLHGFPTTSSVLLWVIYEDQHEVGILADSGDYIYLGPEVIQADLWIVCDVGRVAADDVAAGITSEIGGLTNSIDVYTYTMPKIFSGLKNAGTRLVYYNYGTRELASFNSSCKGRDAIRSLLEINGCFFHMNRYGKPEILFATKSGLYPRNDLYPSEDLFPKGSDIPLMSMGKYISFERADYEVTNYGKIQIKTEADVSGETGKSICAYEYIGDPDYNNVYIIEDNIFYCSDGTVYEYGNQPEVDEMLRNMYNIIKNMRYIPHTTKAIGQPYVECGDRLKLITKTGGAESFIFRRTLKGIHGLKDTYEAEGDEFNEELNTFDYVPYSPGS